MFCYQCGQKLPDDAEFCFKCGVSQNRNEGDVYDGVQKEKNTGYSNDALKIYFSDLLTLECIKSRLQAKLDNLTEKIENATRNNYYKCYVYTDWKGNQKYLHLWYDGKEIKFPAHRDNYGIYNGYSVSVHYELNYDYNAPWFGVVSEWFSIEKELRLFETVWKYKESPMFFSFLGPSIKEDSQMKYFCSQHLLGFKEEAPIEYQKTLDKIEVMKKQYEEIKNEYEYANRLLTKEYDVNILPKQFRDIYAVYYLCDFINTSNETLAMALLNYNLDIIKQKLDQIIEQQQEMIINQALMMAQNEKIMVENKKQLRYLSSIEKNTDRATQYAQIAANNAEACAWIGLANYIKN